MGRSSFVKWSILLLALIIAAACGSSGGGSSGSTADRTPPTILSTSPANNNQNVNPTNPTVSVVFTEAMDKTSCEAAGTFTLEGYYSGDKVPGQAVLDATGRTLAYAINGGSLSPDTWYLASITSTARDAALNPLAQGLTWIFKTSQGEDVTPPTVVNNSMTPANGSVDVPLSTFVTATFSESLDTATINGGSFYLLDKNNSLVSSTVTYNDTTKVATLVPVAPLQDGSFYTARIETSVRDRAGNPLGSMQTWSFTTLDLTPPTVVEVSPRNGEANVLSGATIKITFSESMDAATITGGTGDPSETIRLTGPTGDVTGTVVYNDVTRVASFKPDANLFDDSIYFAIVTTGVKDKKGNSMASQFSWNFVTKDTVSPFVARMFPKSDEVNVQLNTAVTATFSEPVDSVTLNSHTFKLEDTSGSQPVLVPGTVSYNPLTQVATFSPFSPLSNLTTYTASVTSDVRDLSGNQLQGTGSWSFLTVGGGDTTAPAILSVYPTNGQVDVALSVTVRADFSEAMDPVTVNVDSFKVFDSLGQEVPGGVSYDGLNNSALFKPTDLLASNSAYTVQVLTNAKDISGNPLLQAMSWVFTTMDVTPPTVLWTIPANGAKQVLEDSTIQVAFSEPIFTSTLTASAFSLTDSTGLVKNGQINYDLEKNIATLVPTPVNGKGLNTDTYYIARLTVAVKDLAGNAMTEQKTWGFSTRDTQAPTIASRIPAAGAQNVDPAAIVTATFSEFMDPNSINNFTFSLLDSGNIVVPGAINYDSVKRLATFTPLASLNKGENYTVRMTAGVQDEAGNSLGQQVWSFVVKGSGDVTPPTVVSSLPLSGATNLPLTVAISAVFNEALDVTTITTTNVFLTDRDGLKVPATVSYDQATRTVTITPLGLLKDGSFYSARITTGVTDLAGNPIAQAYIWSFTTLDLTPPSVLLVSPLDGSANVDTSVKIIAVFSEVMDAQSITGQTAFKLFGPAGQVNAALTFDNGMNAAVLTPLQPLAPDTAYFATIYTAAKDSSGNALLNQKTWSFSTLDTVAPFVAFQTPAGGAQNVSTATTVMASFSEMVDASTVNTFTFKLENTTGATPVAVPGSITYDPKSRIAVLTPGVALEAGATYTVTVTTNIRDLSGNQIAAPAVWTFQTAAAQDKVRPTVTGVTPADGSNGVSVATGVSVTFSEEIASATLTSDSFKLLDPFGGRVAGNISYNPATRTANFLPASQLALSTRYLVTVSTALADKAGNTLADPTMWVFTTEAPADVTRPTVTGFTPASGAANVAFNTSVTITFSEAMDPATISGESIRLLGPDGGLIAGVVGYDAANKTATFQPASLLSANGYHVAVVTTGVADLAGNTLALQESWGFTTVNPNPADTTAPTVVSTVPVSAAAGVLTSTNVTITFSEAMNPATINGISFVLLDPAGDPVPGVVGYDAGTLSATFQPASALLAGSYYVATVTTDVTDVAGNSIAVQQTWGFTTASAGGADATPPVVTGTTPADGAAAVAVTSIVTVTFDEDIDTATLTSASFKVLNPLGAQVTGNIVYNPATRTATLLPAAALAYSTRYVATVATTVADKAGNGLADPKMWVFTTENPADVTAPTVTSISPVTGAVNVSLTSGVTVTFDEAINPATINGGSITLTGPSGQPVTGVVGYNDSLFSATFKPSAALTSGSYYVATVTTAVADLAGNRLAVQQSWGFTTVSMDAVPPTVVSVSPVLGAVQVPVGANITATFSEEMSAATLTSASFTLTDSTGADVVGAVSYNASSSTATFNPNADLAADTIYTARITLAATDLAGNPLTQEVSWTFKTTDTVPPTVVSLKPVNGANAVAVSSVIEIAFSEPMAQTSLNELTFVVTDSLGVEVAGSIAYYPTINTAAFIPVIPLDTATLYTVVVTTGVTDAGGVPLAANETWSFTTDTTANTNAPTVTATTPADGAANVSLTPSITATFSKPMDASTMTLSNFVLTDGAGNAVGGRVSFDAATETFTFVPNTSLSSDSFYVAQVLAAVKDANGVTMTRGAIWSFRTLALVTTFPAVASTTPDNGDLNVAEGAVITVVFNKPMNPATVNTDSIQLFNGAIQVPGRVTYNTLNDTATFTPLNVLASRTYYTAKVTTGVKDSTGLTINGEKVWTFTTANSSPTVVSVTPADKTVGFPVTGKIQIVFSKDMDPLTINNTNIVMSGPGGDVSGTLSYTFDTILGEYRATFIPTTTLANDSYYVMQVKTGVKDLSGNPLENAKVWSFTTNTVVDSTPPVIMAVIPWDGATNMSVVSKVSATFSEAIDSATLASAFTLEDISDPLNPVAVAGRVIYDNTSFVATFIPDVPLANDTEYRATISNAVTDVAANPLAYLQRQWSFTTIGTSNVTFDMTGYYTGKYISSATGAEDMTLVMLQPAGATYSYTIPDPNDPNATITVVVPVTSAAIFGNFSTNGDPKTYGTISGLMSGDAASVTVTVTSQGCTGTFSGSAAGWVSGTSNITLSYAGQTCHGPEFVSFSVKATVP